MRKRGGTPKVTAHYSSHAIALSIEAATWQLCVPYYGTALCPVTAQHEVCSLAQAYVTAVGGSKTCVLARDAKFGLIGKPWFFESDPSCIASVIEHQHVVGR